MASTQHIPSTPARDRGPFSRHEHDELVAAIQRARIRPDRRGPARRQTVAPMVRSRG
jgi:hypothetical protein